MKLIIIILLLTNMLQFNPYRNIKIETAFIENNISFNVRTNKNSFNKYNGQKWEKYFMKGVNIGASKAGYFPGEFGVSKGDYLRWFKQISDMNANTIRVYTLQKPEFYDALYEFNNTSKKTLNLLQGLWINEEDIETYKNAFNKEIFDKTLKEIEDLVDALHGNKIINEKRGQAYGVYKSDISRYLSGFILGIEWDPEFVLNTNKHNKNKTSFEGEYLYTQEASSFEVFLCEIGDHTIKYQSENYSYQVPLSFTNWPTTDTLKHDNEPIEREDLVEINTEHIKSFESFKPGLFASYHVYPYYPDFMSFQEEYINYKDEKNNNNPYKAYLEDLIKEHTVPVIISEFGVPSSRGISHKNIISNFNQGNLDEITQGKINKKMLKDIYNTGYAGAIIFTWQDEWYKKSWNNSFYDIEDKRAYWYNLQTPEQCYGLLAFEPGEKDNIFYIDGDIREWENKKPLIKNKDGELYVSSDERSLNLMFRAEEKNIDLKTKKIIIPIHVTNNSGAFEYENIKFKEPINFIIEIDGINNSRIKVQEYYDVFSYKYKNNNFNKSNESRFSNKFNNINSYLSSERYLPKTKTIYKEQIFETGKLIYGNNNPQDKQYNSIGDFFINKNIIELRIPWQLLNFMDPSEGVIMGEFSEQKIQELKIDSIRLGIYSKDKSISIPMKNHILNKWSTPTYHERLKKSYYIIRDVMRNIK